MKSLRHAEEERPGSTSGVTVPERKGSLEELFPLPPKPQLQRTPYDFGDDDSVYLHGVTMIGEGEPESGTPFMLEEKGIENQQFVFALDYGGLRFYLSRINERTMNISKTGVLLLGKQDSIQLRGVHESILNGLRAYGIVLPFEFGTVAVGKADLLIKIVEHLAHLKAGLKELCATTWWNLHVYALDARIAQFARPEGLTARRESEKNRPSFQVPAQMGMIDIKTLERVLSKEKKIAESVHGELLKVAERSDVDMIIGLGGGSSDDWKLILKASYDVPAGNVPKLNRVLNDLQYQHFVYELMLTLTGDMDQYSLKTS